ncbi:UL16-binding protein 3-like [Phyllostomus hastatus]|uniref:UL16-binding protein 3-like n=1 Tax=Phyllostomus hastatus TaxID=9423 RepID=UPI001E682A9E|nr:UL16-binding protein 3-like [Phyllostomus hastatus]
MVPRPDRLPAPGFRAAGRWDRGPPRAMEPVGSALGLLLLALVVLRGGAGAPVPAGTQDDAPLHYGFNISFNGQQRCTAKVFMDRMVILEYDCYNKNVTSENQGVMTTNVSKHMKDTLKDVGDKMRRRRLDLKTGKTCGASSILQVRLQCQSAASGTVCGPWECRLGGRRFLVLYPGSGEYKADNSCGDEMKKMWEKDEEVNKFLKKTSEGDCTTWLGGLDRKKVLGTTAAPTMAAASASSPTVSATSTTATTTVPAPSNATNSQNNNIFWIILPLTLLIFIPPVFVLGYICYKSKVSQACSGRCADSLWWTDPHWRQEPLWNRIREEGFAAPL